MNGEIKYTGGNHRKYYSRDYVHVNISNCKNPFVCNWENRGGEFSNEFVIVLSECVEDTVSSPKDRGTIWSYVIGKDAAGWVVNI